ncbi:MAG: NERD domain-containing protein [Granulosicoccus sp.]
MILKKRDAEYERVTALEEMLKVDMTSDGRSRIVQAIARLKSDPTTRFATDLIDEYFDRCDDWLILHDLRLEISGQPVQINHLLLNTAMECFCIDSRYIEYGLMITADGLTHRSDGSDKKLVASPISKLARDTRLLSNLLSSSSFSMRRFFLKRAFTVKGHILTHSALRTSKPGLADKDNNIVIDRESLFSMIFKEPEYWHKLTTRTEAIHTIHKFGESLINLHKPCIARDLYDKCLILPEKHSLVDALFNQCSECGCTLDETTREQALQRMNHNNKPPISRVLCGGCLGAVWQDVHRVSL